MTTSEKITLLDQNDAQIGLCGGEEAIEKQHARYKMTARERLDFLLDKDSFHEIGKYVTHQCRDFGMEKKEVPADGVVTGYGMIAGKKVFVYSQDFTSLGGSMGKMQAGKICQVMDMAVRAGAPMIGINDSGGARIQEGVDSLTGYGEIFCRNSLNSGKIPQITLIMGPCAGGAAYSPALTDIVIMTEKTSQMFCTGPALVKQVTGDHVDAETLGGAGTHAEITGEVHLTARDDEKALNLARKVLSYLPSSYREKPPVLPYEKAEEYRPALDTIMPDSSRHAYDMEEVIREIADRDSFVELQPDFADNIITGFARIGGRSVGIVANQPFIMGGCIDFNAADKSARFVMMCNNFNLPIVSLVDVPGFLPGVDQEYAGILRHGAKMLYAFSVAEVPKITILLRKAYGGAYLAMCSKEMGADVMLAWPTAEVAVMGAEGAVDIVFSRELKDAENKEQRKKELIEEYTGRFSSPYFAAGKGYLDGIIRPGATRKEIIDALSTFENKPHERHYGNMPL